MRQFQMFIFPLAIIIACFYVVNFVTVYALPKKQNPATPPADIIERFDNVLKPPKDHRLYRGLILKNRMKVLLISDSAANKSAACLVVGVGSLNDDNLTPGLANLVAYTLVIGSKNHTYPYGFKEFVTDNGGEMDLPVTEEDNQSFCFKIDSAHLSKALSRFSRFFIDPLLSFMPVIPLEVPFDFVLLEYVVRGLSDECRIVNSEKAMSQKSHPFRHPVLGYVENLKTQIHSLYPKVQEFYNRWYSSNIMTLVVFGKENLNRLENMVTSFFKNIVDKDVQKFHYKFEQHPWGPDQLKRIIYIKSVADDVRVLRLNFPVPDVHDYGSAPNLYIGFCMIHEGPGSLAFVLRSRDLCSDFEVNYDPPAGIAFLTIVCNLTEKGLDEVYEVIHLIFQYIHMLKENGIQKQLFNAFENLQKFAFLRWKPSPDDGNVLLAFVQNIATNLQNYPPEYSVYSRGIGDWDAEQLRKFVEFLRPDNMNISIASRSFTELKDPDTQEASFRCDYIPEEHIKRWSTKESIPEFQLPVPKEVMPVDFTIHPVVENEPKHPYIIRQSTISEIWFKQDDEFRVPYLYMQFDLISSITPLCPFNHILWHIFRILLQLELESNLYSDQSSESEFAKWKISLTSRGIHVKLNGYNDQLPNLLETFFSRLISFGQNISKKNFKRALDESVKTLKNEIKKDQLYLPYRYMQYLHYQGGWTVDVIFNAGRRLQYADMKKFLSKIFRRILIRGLIHGNCTKQKAIEMVNSLENLFYSSSGLLSQEFMLRPRDIEITNASHFVHQLFYEEPEMYVYSAYFQLDTKMSNFFNVAGYVLHEMIQKSCYEIMPKQYQLQNDSSSIFCTLGMNSSGTRRLEITVRSKKDPVYVDSRVEKFIQGVQRSAKNMSEYEFISYKEIIERNLVRPSSLSELCRDYWYEITYREYNFDRSEAERTKLHSLKKSDFQAFVNEMLAPSSSKRAKLAVHVLPRKIKNANPDIISKFIPQKTTKIEDIQDFKNNSSLFPFNYSPLSMTPHD